MRSDDESRARAEEWTDRQRLEGERRDRVADHTPAVPLPKPKPSRLLDESYGWIPRP